MLSVVVLDIYILGGPFTLRAKIFEPLVRSRSLGSPSTLWICHLFCPFEGLSTVGTKILEPFLRSRPLWGPSISWTCHIFYPRESPSTLRTKILEPLVWFIL